MPNQKRERYLITRSWLIYQWEDDGNLKLYHLHNYFMISTSWIMGFIPSSRIFVVQLLRQIYWIGVDYFISFFGFDDVSKGEHCVTMTMSLGKFVQIFYRSMIHSLASLSFDDISFDGLSGVGSSHCFNSLLRRRELYFCLFDNLTSWNNLKHMFVFWS